MAGGPLAAATVTVTADLPLRGTGSNMNSDQDSESNLNAAVPAAAAADSAAHDPAGRGHWHSGGPRPLALRLPPGAGRAAPSRPRAPFKAPCPIALRLPKYLDSQPEVVEAVGAWCACRLLWAFALAEAQQSASSSCSTRNLSSSSCRRNFALSCLSWSHRQRRFHSALCSVRT
jgi:hypothetical protein